jgi:hypothetical protein
VLRAGTCADSQSAVSEQPTIESVINLARSKGRVCPLPEAWTQLWEMLPNPNGDAPLPLTLDAWSLPPRSKMNRLREQLEYADRHGVLDEVDAFLRSLSESDWLHLQ